MASGNLVLGTLRGKLGDMVTYRSLGKQRVRAKASSVKNPKSILQTLQRTVLSSAAKTVAVLDPIVNHSFQSVAYGPESKRYARKLIMKVLREQLVAAYNDEARTTSAQQVGAFPMYGNGAAVAPYLISQGSITAPQYTCEESKGNSFGGYVAGFTPTASTSVYAFLRAMGADINTQVTLVFLTPRKVGEHPNGTSFYSGDLRLVRLNFLPEKIQAPLFTDGSGQDGAPFIIDSDNVDIARSNNVESALFYGSEVETGAIAYKYADTAGASENSVGAFAVILSRYENDKWLRSTARLAVPYPIENTEDAQVAQPGIGFNYFEELLEAEIEAQAVAEDRYLNKEKN